MELYSGMTIAQINLYCVQDDLKYLEASEDKNEEFYGGGGEGAAAGRTLEHFPQLWCPNGTYSAYGQARVC